MADVSTMQTALTVAGEIVVAAIACYGVVRTARLEKRVDGRVDELLELTKKSAKADGAIEGARTEIARAAVETVSRLREQAALKEEPPK